MPRTQRVESRKRPNQATETGARQSFVLNVYKSVQYAAPHILTTATAIANYGKKFGVQRRSRGAASVENMFDRQYQAIIYTSDVTLLMQLAYYQCIFTNYI
jgi:hypothetical protein